MTSKANWTFKFNIVVILVVFVMAGEASKLDKATYDALLEDTELVFALVVTRQGDRTPLPFNKLALYGDENAIEELIEPWGYGQLTNVGRRTSYKTGQYIRKRYKSLIPEKYNHSEIYIQSAAATRTEMTALTAMAAVFPPTKDSWSKDINWVPVPYSTVAAEVDYLSSYDSCPTWREIHDKIKNSPIIIPEYEDTILKTAKIQGYEDLAVMQTRIFETNDVYTSLISLGYDVGDEIRCMLPDIAGAACKALDIFFESDIMIQLYTGVVLRDFFTHADEIISGKCSQKIRLYSAYDINIYSLGVAIQVTNRLGMPNYGGLISLELRRIPGNGQYFVVPVYKPDPHKNEEIYLEIKNCGVFCGYETLYSLTKKYQLDEKTWRKKCKID